mgnify:CR=1 FL=1
MGHAMSHPYRFLPSLLSTSEMRYLDGWCSLVIPLSQQATAEGPPRGASWNFLGFSFTVAEVEEYNRNRSPHNVACQNSSCKSKAKTSSKLDGKYLCPACWYRETQASRYSEGERVLLLHGAHPLVCSEGLTAESTRELPPTISSTSVRVCASS